MRIVVKIGTSSLTAASGEVEPGVIRKLCDEVATLRTEGHEVVIITSGAITAGLPSLGFAGNRPRDTTTLQAAAAVGQSHLLRAYNEALAPHDLVSGQILLSPQDFIVRRQYLHARSTMERLLQLGVVPVVNENDAIADAEIRWGDNDRLAALVSHCVTAELLVLLTDTAGVYTGDPRTDNGASLIEEVKEADRYLDDAAGGSGSDRGSGGMASKVVAARMAARSGVRAVVAGADKADVLMNALAGETVGTTFAPRAERLSAKKLWIAYAAPTQGVITVDDGAYEALARDDRSLLPAGVTGVRGHFGVDDAVEIADGTGRVAAKGLARIGSEELTAVAGKRSRELAIGTPTEAVHRDDLVVLV